MKLRHYQELALSETARIYREGTKRVLIHAGTGTGKTVIFCEVLRRVAEKGRRAVMAVKGVLLVDQASFRLRRECVPHGVYQASHPGYDPDQPIQICSIDTLYRRQIAPKADLIVIDECDLTLGKSYEWFLGNYPDAYVLGVTATPHVPSGLRHIADDVVHPITMREAIDQKWLVGAEYFAPEIPNLTGVGDKGSDFNTQELSAVMAKSGLVGNVVETYRELGEQRAAVCFAVTQAHSKALRDQFNSQGIRAEHLQDSTPFVERLAALERLRAGLTKVICNVGILCRGVDIPWLRCIILARPTKSYNLHVQQLGRGTRPYEGKTNFRVLDHAGNTLRHGFIEDEKPCELDGYEKKIEREDSGLTTCKDCFAVFPRGPTCPACGREIPVNERVIVQAEGKLKRVRKPVKARPPDNMLKGEIAKIKRIARTKGRKLGWVFYVIKARYGKEVAQEYWPYIMRE